jgi:hypothetical protein
MPTTASVMTTVTRGILISPPGRLNLIESWMVRRSRYLTNLSGDGQGHFIFKIIIANQPRGI